MCVHSGKAQQAFSGKHVARHLMSRRLSIHAGPWWSKLTSYHTSRDAVVSRASDEVTRLIAAHLVEVGPLVVQHTKRTTSEGSSGSHHRQHKGQHHQLEEVHRVVEQRMAF